MRFVLMLEPQQGLTYEEQLAIAHRVEVGGFEGLFRSDHYESFPGPADNPTTDAWAVLAGLARETSGIQLGALVSPVTFRLPGTFAKIVGTVDEMSGGRIEVGLGAGWNDSEHQRHGIPFPPISVRADMLEEQLEILHGLWGEPDGWSFEGRHYQVRDARLRPRPSAGPGRPVSAAGHPRMRIIVGGNSPRTVRLAARWADEYNLTSSTPEQVAENYAALDEACRAIGRDPASITRSAMVGVLVGEDEAAIARREADMLAAFGQEEAGEEWVAQRRHRWIHGTPEQARAAVARYAAVGVERIMLQDFLPRDLDMIELIGRELVARG